MSDFKPAPLPPSIIEMSDGGQFMQDTKGALVPIGLVRPQDQLQDDTVRTIVGHALALNKQIARFREHTFDDIGAFEAVLAQEYDTTIGGRKGNKTLMSYCGRFKVEVSVQDRIDFGPELEIAKALIDECLTEWSSDSRPEIQAIVTRAFNTDKPGQVNRSELFMLLKLDIDDARWIKAMQAIRDAMRVVGSKTYVRSYQRDTPDAAWQAITIDLAKA